MAGSYITQGHVTRDAHFRLLRENVVIYTGEIESLRRLKDDMSRKSRKASSAVSSCKNYNDIREGDHVGSASRSSEIARTL